MKKYIISSTVIIFHLFFAISVHTAEMNIGKTRERMYKALNTMNTISREVKNGQLFKLMNYEHGAKLIDSAVRRSQNSSEIILSSKIKYSEPFLISLLYDTEAFETFIHFYKIGRIPLSTYSNVLNASLDLEMKARVVKTRSTDRVEVRVNTVDLQGHDVHNCIVWYAPFLLDDEQHTRKFDKLSTPTTDWVPAGLWKIWTEKSGKIGPRSPLGCGENERGKREIDILAP